MTQDRQGAKADADDLWRDFPKTATEFEARFATEDDCRAYWIKARWGGAPAGAVSPKHLQAYLDEYAFRHNRRRTKGVGRVAARVIKRLVAHAPLTMPSIVDHTVRSRRFRAPALAGPA